MSDSAIFWSIDLHTHTPASRDVDPSTYGGSTPQEVVDAAVGAGLDAIAITDHNTTEWCEPVAAAAVGSPLLVLPGVEISTTEGHLLGIWEAGTQSSAINDVLVSLGIKTADFGKLDIATTGGLQEAAQVVAESGGLAIAAHVDRPKGLLGISVAARQKAILLDESLSAVEVVHDDAIETVNNKLGGDRQIAFVRGSDMIVPGTPHHVLNGIGRRRTYIKASRPDLVGLRHALNDPDLRVSLSEPLKATYPVITSVEFHGGFLNGETIHLSPDLNCLLGGTGTGKSLIIEAIRYALDQQVDRRSFPHIADEVHSRMQSALTNTGVVRVSLTAGSERFLIERVMTDQMDGVIKVSQLVNEDWVEIDSDPEELVEISAFSQGEALEYARQPVGRMSLVDSALDLSDLDAAERDLQRQLSANADRLVDQREVVAALQEAVGDDSDLVERVRELGEFFDGDQVKQQEGWKSEGAELKRIQEGLGALRPQQLNAPASPKAPDGSGNSDLFDSADAALAELRAGLDEGFSLIETALARAQEQIGRVEADWRDRFTTYKAELDAALDEMGEGASLVALRGQLERFQEQLVQVRRQREQLNDHEIPKLNEIKQEREQLIDQLQAVRTERRNRRRTRVDALNALTGGAVRVDIPAEPDSSRFREGLERLKTGSHVREEKLDVIGARIHPLRFGRELFNDNLGALVNDELGIDLADLTRLHAAITDRDLWRELLSLQVCEMPDQLNVRFKKPGEGAYVSIEQLAHGQRCTAILVLLLADGTAPVIIDQPEDALHAPWIEEYLVDRLRDLRGSRQYLCATRSPGIVVSADAEQIVTMKATAGQGRVEASGSLERHDLNALALHHLEGGPVAFRRRSSKLGPSVDS